MELPKPDTTESIVAALQNPEPWRDFAERNAFPSSLAVQTIDERMQKLLSENKFLNDAREEGYTIWPNALSAEVVKPVRKIIDTLAEAGWLAPFAFLYDETWEVFRSAPVTALVANILGDDYLQLPDFYAWIIPAQARSHGFHPHREIADSGYTDADGSPVSLTVWIPLTNATPDNGCMYVIPRNLEFEHFEEADLIRMYGKNVMAAVLHRARALPGEAGTLMSWNHEIMHWGSFSSNHALEPRISMAFEFVRRDAANGHIHSSFVKPAPDQTPVLLDPCGPLPTFEQRVYLLARCINNYGTRNTDKFYQAAQTILSTGTYPQHAAA